MLIEQFKEEFKHMNGVFAADHVMLFRKPVIELYDLSTDQTLSTFETVDDALKYELNGQTIEDRIKGWNGITFTYNGGRGSSSDEFSGKWEGSGSMGPGSDDPDFAARINVRLSGKSRSYEDTLNEFAKMHANSGKEHAITVDTSGFATQYEHGNGDSVAIRGNASRLTRANGMVGDMVIHNHPQKGWPTFSKEDVMNAANNGAQRGVVAVSGLKGRNAETAKYAGTYTFTKTANFDATAFTKALNKATIHGKDYNDAVNKWMRANQKRYGYKYTYKKAEG